MRNINRDVRKNEDHSMIIIEKKQTKRISIEIYVHCYSLQIRKTLRIKNSRNTEVYQCKTHRQIFWNVHGVIEDINTQLEKQNTHTDIDNNDQVGMVC